jgi:Peptidase A4 family
MSGDPGQSEPQADGGTGTRQLHDLPDGFDPVAAADAELARYGYPRRPDQAAQPLAYQRWKSVVTRPVIRTPAVFGGPPVFPGPPGGVIGTGVGPQPGTAQTSGNWAGRTAGVASSQYPIQTIYGTWTVPRVLQPPVGSDTYACASWIGLDGQWADDPTPVQLIQAGTTVGATHGSPGRPTWFEWLPDGQKQITNFDFEAGDIIQCTIDVTGRDDEGFIDDVYVTWVNLTTAKSVSGPQSRPKKFENYTYTVPAPGFAANWILELPSGIADTVLAQFGSVYYDDCWAYTNGPEAALDAGQAA